MAETVRYNRRQWLNDPSSESTGSVVCFSGDVKRRDGKTTSEDFVEIADCVMKVRLHRLPDETVEQFVKKLERLTEEVSRYCDYLMRGK